MSAIRGPESPGDTRRRLVSIRPAPIPVGTGPLRLDPALSSGKRFPVCSPLTRGGGQLPASRRDGTRLRSRTPNPWGSAPWPGAGRRAPGRPTDSWEPAWRPCPRRTAPPAPGPVLTGLRLTDRVGSRGAARLGRSTSWGLKSAASTRNAKSPALSPESGRNPHPAPGFPHLCPQHLRPRSTITRRPASSLARPSPGAGSRGDRS